MTLVSVFGGHIGEITRYPQSYSGFTIDATGEKCAAIIQVPKTGSITHVGFRTKTVTSSQTLRVGLETHSTNPTGTQYGGSAVGTQASPASSTFYEVALATPASAVQGDIIAIVIQFNATVGAIDIGIGVDTVTGSIQFPFIQGGLGASGAWSNRDGRTPCATLKYSDGTYPDFLAVPWSSIDEDLFDSASTPDERGLKFKLPFPCQVTGAYSRHSTQSGGGTTSIVLYDSDGTTALTTLANFPESSLRNEDNEFTHLLFPASVNLLANTFYRMTYKATHATQDTKIRRYTVQNAAMLDSFPGGQNFHWTSRTDSGAWTDVLTQRPGLGPIFSKLDDGASPGQKALVVTGSRNY